MTTKISRCVIFRVISPQNSLSLFVLLCGFNINDIPVNVLHYVIGLPSASLHYVLVRYADCVHDMKAEVWKFQCLDSSLKTIRYLRRFGLVTASYFGGGAVLF